MQHLGRDQYGFEIPVRVRIGPFKAYFIASANHYDTILRGAARELKSDLGTLLSIQVLFASPKDVEPFYLADKSGIAATPLSGTKEKPEDRIHYLRHHSSVKYLAGPHLKGMTERFVDQFRRQIMEHEEIQDEWVEYPDFADFLQKELFRAATFSMCGPNLLAINPDLLEDFWTFIGYIPIYTRALPRWFNPDAYRVRDKVIAAIKNWHQFAFEKSGLSKPDDAIWDSYWGAKIMKERYTYSHKMSGMTADARAAEDLAIIFA